MGAMGAIMVCVGLTVLWVGATRELQVNTFLTAAKNRRNVERIGNAKVPAQYKNLIRFENAFQGNAIDWLNIRSNQHGNCHEQTSRPYQLENISSIVKSYIKIVNVCQTFCKICIEKNKNKICIIQDVIKWNYSKLLYWWKLFTSDQTKLKPISILFYDMKKKWLKNLCSVVIWTRLVTLKTGASIGTLIIFRLHMNMETCQ